MNAFRAPLTGANPSRFLVRQMPSPNKELRVVCAVFSDEEGRHLVAKRSAGKALAGRWEFPGGKVAPGEDPRDALCREIREEMGAEIQVTGVLREVVHHYQSISIRLLPFLVHVQSGELRALEHEEIRWVSLQELDNLNMADADVAVARELSTLASGDMASPAV
ncbi:MAG: (deoxy)nucleoside triphosphate pyrophosphohydrolase [Opitutales bacterium]